MQCPKLSDDELWRAIARNTDTMSALLLEERDDSEINPCTRADLVLFVNSQYSDYTAELRRRHHCLNPVGGSISTPIADSLAPPAQTLTEVGESMPSDADLEALSVPLMVAAPKREAVTEKRGAMMKILLTYLARCAAIPAVIQYGVVAALISVLIVGALDYGYGPYDYDYTAESLYDDAGPASMAPVHAAPPYGPLVFTPQIYAPASTTSPSLMIVTALFMAGASLAVAQNWPAVGGQPPVADGAASKLAAPGSAASISARTAQHHGIPHDRMYMMLVKAPIKVQIDAR